LHYSENHLAPSAGQDGPQSRPKSQKGCRVNAVEVDTDDDYAFLGLDWSTLSIV